MLGNVCLLLYILVDLYCHCLLSVFPFFTIFNCAWAWKHKFGERCKQVMGRKGKSKKKRRRKQEGIKRKNLWPLGGVKQTVIALHKYLRLMRFQPFYLGTRFFVHESRNLLNLKNLQTHFYVLQHSHTPVVFLIHSIASLPSTVKRKLTQALMFGNSRLTDRCVCLR